MTLLVGEPGIGKTTVVEALLERGARGQVFRGNGAHIPGLESLHQPFGMLVEAFRSLEDSPDSELRRALQTWLSPPESAVTAVDPGHHRMEGLLSIVRRLAEQDMVILVLEDLHWADSSTLATVMYLRRHLSHERVAILGTSRPAGHGSIGTPYDSFLEHMHRSTKVMWYELHGLSDDEMQLLLVGCGETDSRRMHAIAELAEGNPLAAVEMASAPGGRKGLVTPQSVEWAIGQTWQALSMLGQEVLSACAVIGRDVPHYLLAQVLTPDGSGWTTHWHEATQEVLNTGILLTTSDGYRFRHALDRVAVYRRTLPDVRNRLHGMVAGVLEIRPTSTLSEAERHAIVASHWSMTGDEEATTRSSAEAAFAAFRTGAVPEALSHFERAVRGWQSMGRAPAGWQDRSAQVFRTAAECARHLGEPSRGIALLRDGLPFISGDDTALAWASTGTFLHEMGNESAAVAALERAQALALHDAVRAEALERYARVAGALGKHDQAHDLAVEALRLCGSIPSAVHARAIHWAVYNDLAHLDSEHIDACLARLREAQEMALGLEADLSLDYEAWQFFSGSLLLLFLAGRGAELGVACHEALERINHSGLAGSPSVIASLAQIGSCLFEVGRWDEVLALADAMMEEDTPVSRASAGLLAAKAEVHLLRNENDDMQACMDILRRVAAKASSVAVELKCLEAEHHLWQGDPDQAHERIGAALRQGPAKLELWSLLARHGLRAEAERSGFGSDRVRGPRRRVLRDGLNRLRESWPLEPPPYAAEAALCLAEDSRIDHHDTPKQWARGADLWSALHQPYLASYARLRQGEALLRTGDRRGAVKALAVARELARALGAMVVLDAVGAVAHRSRLQLDPASPPERTLPPKAEAFGLTRREVEVLSFLLEGETDRHIARALTISERTVGVHVSHILAKLGVASRAQAAAVAHRTHLLAR